MYKIHRTDRTYHCSWYHEIWSLTNAKVYVKNLTEKRFKENFFGFAPVRQERCNYAAE